MWACNCANLTGKGHAPGCSWANANPHLAMQETRDSEKPVWRDHQTIGFAIGVIESLKAQANQLSHQDNACDKAVEQLQALSERLSERS